MSLLALMGELRNTSSIYSHNQFLLSRQVNCLAILLQTTGM